MRNQVEGRTNPNFSSGYYCLYGNFSAHAATATVKYSESTGAEAVQEVGILPGDLKGCPVSATGAPVVANVLVRRSTDYELQDAGFFITFN